VVVIAALVLTVNAVIRMVEVRLFPWAASGVHG
jgi:hypothetical protein